MSNFPSVPEIKRLAKAKGFVVVKVLPTGLGGFFALRRLTPCSPTAIRIQFGSGTLSEVGARRALWGALVAL